MTEGMRRPAKVIACIALAMLAGQREVAAQVFPGATWEFRTPAQVGLDPAVLDAARDYIGGRGCVVRHGYMAYTWGSQSQRQDIASACKPWISTFLFKAVETGRLSSVDDLVVNWEQCLTGINPGLGYKDRNITFRHMANQISCYGVREAPGTAFDYNDWQMALFWDTLFLKVYGATYNNVDATVYHPMLTDLLQCEDNPTMMFLPDRAGRIGISVRDFARFGLLYLHKGNWKGTQIVSEAHATMAVTSPLPLSIPRTTAVPAEMCAGARSIGSTVIPDNQNDHEGSYSWLWWVNGVGRTGQRRFPDCPLDTYGAFGHGNGQRAVVVIPSLDMVISWNDTTLGSKPGNPGEAIKRVAAAALPENPYILLTPGAIEKTAEYGQDLPDQTFTVTNTGIGELNYEIESDQSWLAVAPTAGTSTGESDTITIEYNTAGLSLGPHSASIRVSDAGSTPAAGNSPQTITVALQVVSVLPDLDRDTDVDQEDFGLFQRCLGASAVPQIPAECQPCNFNRDDLIDQVDFNVLWGCLSGSGHVADHTCDDAWQ